jgi:hypothetical protein
MNGDAESGSLGIGRSDPTQSRPPSKSRYRRTEVAR